jgi:hypothetical protein
VDIIDEANDLAQMRNDKALEAARNQPPEAVATGHCLNCDELLLEHGQRWCDADCRDDWEKRKEAARRAPPL